MHQNRKQVGDKSTEMLHHKDKKKNIILKKKQKEKLPQYPRIMTNVLR